MVADASPHSGAHLLGDALRGGDRGHPARLGDAYAPGAPGEARAPVARLHQELRHLRGCQHVMRFHRHIYIENFGWYGETKRYEGDVWSETMLKG